MYILNESWKGMDRVTPEWFKIQADALTHSDEDDLDRQGLAALLYEMSERDYRTAESAAIQLIKHLLLVFISPNNDAQRHWLQEIMNFIDLFEKGVGVEVERESGNTNIKNKLKQNWAKIYNKAIKKVLYEASIAWSFNQFYTDRIPEENPWTVEDFLTKSPGELLSILAPKN